MSNKLKNNAGDHRFNKRTTFAEHAKNRTGNGIAKLRRRIWQLKYVILIAIVLSLNACSSDAKKTPEYKDAKQKVKDATELLEKANEALENAEDYEEALEAREKAKEALKKAEDKLKEAEEKVGKTSDPSPQDSGQGTGRDKFN